jgi:hypothetical protein
MVLIDALPSGADEAGAEDDGSAFAVGPGDPAVDRPTLDPPRRRRSRRAVAALAVAAVLVVGAGVAVGVGGDRSGDGDATGVTVLAEQVDADGGDSSDADGTDGSDGTAPVTTGSSKAGVQKDTIVYDLPGVENETPRLATALQDTAAIFGPLDPAGPPAVIEVPQLPVDRTPARLQYEAYNQANNIECKAFLSRELVLTGVWVRVATTSQSSLVNAVVMAFEDEEMAREAFVSFSLEQGPTSGECRGFRDGGSGVLDYDELDVVHREPALVGLPAGTRYNSWLRLANSVSAAHAFSLNTVSQRDRFVILFSEFTTTEVGPPSAETASSVLADILTRL